MERLSRLMRAKRSVSCLSIFYILLLQTALFGEARRTSSPLDVRTSDVAPNSASTARRKDLACAASARLLSRDDSWCSAMAKACSSRLGRRAESPTSSHAVVQGAAVLITLAGGLRKIVSLRCSVHVHRAPGKASRATSKYIKKRTHTR